MEEEGESEMGRKRSQKRSQGELEESAGEMHERLWSWRRERPEASFDEIMERVRREREAMMRVPKWWHMPQYVWQIANQAMEPASAEASAWVKAQKAALARGQLGLFFSHILRLYPKLGDAPPEVKQAVAYLWKNRRRMHYAAYRKAGLPISSGAVESAAKTLVQQRMKQSGMRWSRDGAQAMLARRVRLLSDRWHEIPI